MIRSILQLRCDKRFVLHESIKSRGQILYSAAAMAAAIGRSRLSKQHHLAAGMAVLQAALICCDRCTLRQVRCESMSSQKGFP